MDGKSGDDAVSEEHGNWARIDRTASWVQSAKGFSGLFGALFVLARPWTRGLSGVWQDVKSGRE